jgi:hypothetical protein
MAGGRQSKVARVINEYDLPDLGDYLEERWTDADTESRASLRQLADEMNLRLLERALSEAGERLFDEEVETLYHRLTTDDVSSKDRTRARARLEGYGIDVDGLLENFVSRQAIHTYLTEHRNVSAPQSETAADEQRTVRLESVQALRFRLEAVSESVLTRLRDAGKLTLGEFSVVVTVRVHCADCNTRFPVTTLLKSGSCECESAP